MQLYEGARGQQAPGIRIERCCAWHNSYFYGLIKIGLFEWKSPNPSGLFESAPQAFPGTIELFESLPQVFPGTIELFESLPQAFPGTIELFESVPQAFPGSIELFESIFPVSSALAVWRFPFIIYYFSDYFPFLLYLTTNFWEISLSPIFAKAT